MQTETPTPQTAADGDDANLRFPFGKNWARFIELLDDNRVEVARRSLIDMLGRERFDGLRFLDAGSGSGLFSLAARSLGATVHSFDFDSDSVRCTAELRRRYYKDDPAWVVEQGSVLDDDFLAGLGTFDIVYCWGVLHHTGAMWKGLDLIHRRVAHGGALFIMIYMDRGWRSDMWRAIKKFYNMNVVFRGTTLAILLPYFVIRGLVSDILKLKNPLARYTNYDQRRGMSRFRDWIDWIGGYPYEVATRDEIVSFFGDRGFRIVREQYQEYVFERR